MASKRPTTCFSLKWDISMILRLVATFYGSNSSPQNIIWLFFLVGLVSTGLSKVLNTKIRNEYDVSRQKSSTPSKMRLWNCFILMKSTFYMAALFGSFGTKSLSDVWKLIRNMETQTLLERTNFSFQTYTKSTICIF
jgi:hypothetical protein